MGAVLHKGSYFRDPWNVIDAVVVCANVATLAIRFVSLICLILDGLCEV